MDKRFQGQTVLITGAAGGFGSAVAKMFADAGAQLLLSDLDKDAVFKLEAELKARHVTCAVQCFDVACETGWSDHIKFATEAVGEIHIAINNAGIGQNLEPLQDTEAETFDRIMTVNSRSVFLGMKAVLP